MQSWCEGRVFIHCHPLPAGLSPRLFLHVSHSLCLTSKTVTREDVYTRARSVRGATPAPRLAADSFREVRIMARTLAGFFYLTVRRLSRMDVP